MHAGWGDGSPHSLNPPSLLWTLVLSRGVPPFLAARARPVPVGTSLLRPSLVAFAAKFFSSHIWRMVPHGIGSEKPVATPPANVPARGQVRRRWTPSLSWLGIHPTPCGMRCAGERLRLGRMRFQVGGLPSAHARRRAFASRQRERLVRTMSKIVSDKVGSWAMSPFVSDLIAPVLLVRTALPLCRRHSAVDRCMDMATAVSVLVYCRAAL